MFKMLNKMFKREQRLYRAKLQALLDEEYNWIISEYDRIADIKDEKEREWQTTRIEGVALELMRIRSCVALADGVPVETLQAIIDKTFANG